MHSLDFTQTQSKKSFRPITVLAFQYSKAPGKHTENVRHENHKTDILVFFRHHVWCHCLKHEPVCWALSPSTLSMYSYIYTVGIELLYSIATKDNLLHPYYWMNGSPVASGWFAGMIRLRLGLGLKINLKIIVVVKDGSVKLLLLLNPNQWRLRIIFYSHLCRT